MRRFPERVVGLIQQQKDDQKDNRNDQFESRAGTDFIFVLSAPLDVITGRHTDLPSDNTLSIGNKAANVASLNVHEYCASKQSVFAGNHARSITSLMSATSPNGICAPFDAVTRTRCN